MTLEGVLEALFRLTSVSEVSVRAIEEHRVRPPLRADGAGGTRSDKDASPVTNGCVLSCDWAVVPPPLQVSLSSIATAADGVISPTVSATEGSRLATPACGRPAGSFLLLLLSVGTVTSFLPGSAVSAPEATAGVLPTTPELWLAVTTLAAVTVTGSGRGSDARTTVAAVVATAFVVDAGAEAITMASTA